MLVYFNSFFIDIFCSCCGFCLVVVCCCGFDFCLLTGFRAYCLAIVVADCCLVGDLLDCCFMVVGVWFDCVSFAVGLLWC